MAVFDLKKATVSLCDGRLAALTTTAAAGINAKVTLTDVNTHRGTQPPVTITIVVSGNGTAQSVVVSKTDITFNSATDGGGLATSTATAMKNALNADPNASLLVLASLPGTGATVVEAQAKTALALGARTLSLKICEGTLSFSEKKPMRYIRDKGILSEVVDGDQEPLDFKLDLVWEHLEQGTSEALSPIDVVKHDTAATAWVTTDPDPCQPFCIDIEILFNPNCGSIDREWITLPLARYESIDFDAKAATFMVSGKCNVTQAIILRAA